MNEQDELNDKIFGKDVNAKRNAFNKAIEDLGQEYANYFNNRKSKLEFEEHDKIMNHFRIANNGAEEWLSKNDDSDISKEIENRFIALYKKFAPIYF